MNRSEEKSLIYSMMQDITNEKSRLTDVYVSLLGRLSELDKTDKSEQTVKHEEIQKKESSDTVEEIQEIEETSASLLESATTLDDTPKEPLFKVNSNNNDTTESMADIINRHNSQLGNEEVIEKSTHIVPKTEIQKEIDKLPKKSAQLDSDKVTGYIVTVLKKAGKPLSAKDIYTRICEMSEYEIKKTNFTSNILPRAIKKNKRIQKAMFGYYQYSTTV